MMFIFYLVLSVVGQFMKRLFVILTFKSIVYSHSIETSFVEFISKDCTKNFFFIFEGNYSPVLAIIRNKGLKLSIDKLYFLYCMFSYRYQIMAYFTVEPLSGFIF